MNDLVSIIIPTYNRVQLIGETLDSILTQTYENWECIIVDDQSTDESISLIEKYTKKDQRFCYYVRQSEALKGANTCRNIGIDKAKGKYIIFFDSDDLMTNNHISLKVNAILEKNLDYVITRTKFFNADSSKIDKYYRFDLYKITPFNYITQKINWLTYDICLKADLAKKIRFNEKLQSGQEYNYFSKLVFFSTKGTFVDEVVTYRRYTENSIRNNLKTESKINFGSFQTHWHTYLDIKYIANLEVRQYLLKVCINIIYEEKQILLNEKLDFLRAIFIEFKLKGFYFLCMMFSLKTFNKGHFFKMKLIK